MSNKQMAEAYSPETQWNGSQDTTQRIHFYICQAASARSKNDAAKYLQNLSQLYLEGLTFNRNMLKVKEVLDIATDKYNNSTRNGRVKMNPELYKVLFKLETEIRMNLKSVIMPTKGDARTAILR